MASALLQTPICVHAAAVQVLEDVYEKIDKELLAYVEDVLLNRCGTYWCGKGCG